MKLPELSWQKSFAGAQDVYTSVEGWPSANVDEKKWLNIRIDMKNRILFH
jgi:hypothetical protein